MITLLRTDSSHPDFAPLVQLLDTDLAKRDGDDHAFYAQFNKVHNLQHVVIAYKNGVAMACGAFKFFEKGRVEVKRMYVKPEARNQGIADKVLQELEQWATEEGNQYTVLETGKKQPEAIQLYKKRATPSSPIMANTKA